MAFGFFLLLFAYIRVFFWGGWFGFCGIWSLLSFMTSSCKNDRERLRLHWTQFDYKTTHTQSIKYGWVVWFSFVLALFFSCCGCVISCIEFDTHIFLRWFWFLFWVAGAIENSQLKSKFYMLLLAIKVDLFSKLFAPMKWILIFIWLSLLFQWLKKWSSFVDRKKEQYHNITQCIAIQRRLYSL